MNTDIQTSMLALLANEPGYDPLEDRLRLHVRGVIEAVFEEELQTFLGRCRYVRGGEGTKGHRNGHRSRQIIGTFGAETVQVPRARILDEDGQSSEWRSKALPRYQRLTRKAEALIAAVYLAGTNTRRVKRALFGLFQGAVSKDVVSRAWRKVKTDWDAWCGRSLVGEDRFAGCSTETETAAPDKKRGDRRLLQHEGRATQAASFLRRRAKPRPARPRPNRVRVAGSGT